ncbi:MAG: amidase, partial [Gammaproteobacteria bacterium]
MAERHDVATLLRAYRARALSPCEVVDAALARIDACLPRLNAFVLVDHDSARTQARASARRWLTGRPCGPLDGVPVTIKDMNDVQGWPTRAGSRLTPAAPAAADASPVARLREAGAVFLGKTTAPEFGWTGVTESPLTGSTRNPWDPTRTAGGSSGGAAVAAALDLGTLHLGGDGGGSIRIPAAFCGVFGFKPSFARVPRYPQHSPLRLTQAGPLTASVADACAMLAVITRPDRRDWMALPDPATGAHACELRAAQDVRGRRVAYAPGFAGGAPEAGVRARVDAAAGVFASLGAVVETIDDPLGSTVTLFTRYWEAAQAYAQHHRSRAERAAMDAGLVAMLEAGEHLAFTDFAELMRARIVVGERLTALFTRYDLLLTPTLPLTAFTAGDGVPPGSGLRSWIDWACYCHPFNLGGHPAASCPCGFAADGLPVGVQVAGPMYADAAVLRACAAFEQAA